MGKTTIAALFVAALGVAGYASKQQLTFNNDGLSDLQLANAEALAEDETKGYHYVHEVIEGGIVVGCNCSGERNKDCCGTYRD
ncbi:MAG: NVEALA domain-containing protein [Candidatus Amulumruptor sp.]|nr:NVEALA domain-containing protein [Candidatus Amulumruptor sp.]